MTPYCFIKWALYSIKMLLRSKWYQPIFRSYPRSNLSIIHPHLITQRFFFGPGGMWQIASRHQGPISPSAVNSQSGVKQAILPHPNLTKCGGVKSMPSKLPHAVKPILPHFCGKTEGFLPRYRRTEANNQLFAADFTPNANWFYGTISAVKQRTEAKWYVMNRRIFRPRINTDQDLSPAKFR